MVWLCVVWIWHVPCGLCYVQSVLETAAKFEVQMAIGRLTISYYGNRLYG
jgi:hypothetical protein